MEAYYSIIYYKLNSLTDEHLAVGFFAGGGEGPFLYLSNKRVRLMKETLHRNTFLAVQRHLKALKQKVDHYRSNNKELMLFDPHYSKEEFDRLNKDTNGAIRYSAPITINEWLSGDVFDKLVNQFLGDNINKKSSKKPLFYLKWKAYYHSKQFENWEKDVLLNELDPTISMNVRIDLLNRDKKQIVKTIDFDLSQNNIAKKRYEIELIANALKNFEVICIYPTPLKREGRECCQSIINTLHHISFVNFKEFKQIH
ncbi:MAG: hypothetical protein WED10_15330 [Brumimicrobium sp.]